MRNVAVIDYGMGNIYSVISALKYLGVGVSIADNTRLIEQAEGLILPGVGSFRKGMNALRERGMIDAILQSVVMNKPILGICLGMQLMGAYGTEDGGAEGLGIVANKVEGFTKEEVGERKIPHVGFDQIRCGKSEGIFAGLPELADFYFTHSYRMKLENKMRGLYATCAYGTDFLAAFDLGNICGTQFHPEKSQVNGLIVLKNFLKKLE